MISKKSKHNPETRDPEKLKKLPLRCQSLHELPSPRLPHPQSTTFHSTPQSFSSLATLSRYQEQVGSLGTYCASCFFRVHDTTTHFVLKGASWRMDQARTPWRTSALLKDRTAKSLLEGRKIDPDLRGLSASFCTTCLLVSFWPMFCVFNKAG